jgi:hypothetical protein
MQDGTPPHIHRDVNYLNNEYGNKWIGRNGPVMWPPRSPDLNPLDFYFWFTTHFLKTAMSYGPGFWMHQIKYEMIPNFLHP